MAQISASQSLNAAATTVPAAAQATAPQTSSPRAASPALAALAYRPDIDGLRTVAVLPVVVFHAGLGLTGGFVGVDVFFVISGFLITSILIREIETGEFSILRFYERRARRLLPALFAMLALTSVAALVVMTPFDLVDYGRSLIATTMFTANIWFHGQEGYFTEAAELEPLLHTWSLGVEEQYYIAFPLILLALTRLAGARWAQAPWVFAGLAALMAGSFAWSLAALANTPQAAFYLTHLRAWELLAGSLLAMAMMRGWINASALPKWGVEALGILGLAAILFAIIGYNAQTPFPGVAALAPCLGAALLIAVGARHQGLVTRALSRPAMVFVGKLSYSLYLWHWPVIALYFYRYGELDAVAGVGCIAVSCALAYLSWRFVEKPMRDRNAVSEKAIMWGTGAALATSCAAGLTLVELDGMPGRMDPVMLAMAQPDTFLHDRRDCHFVTPTRAQAGDVCVRGAASKQPSFVLLGDSHADALSPAVFAAAKDRGIAGYQYTDAGLIALPGVTRVGQKRPGEVEALVAFLAARPDIRTILITRYWQHQISGTTYRQHGDVWRDAGYDGSGSAYNATATFNGITRLAALFPDRAFILIDDVPTGSALHIRDQLRRMGAIDPGELGLSANAAMAQRAQYEPVLQRLAARVPNIEYRPIFANFCSNDLCPLFDGDTLLYRNGDHLSWKGAMAQKDRVGALFDQR